MGKDMNLDATEIPRHVGIIPDGTRRWSRVHGVPLQDAYIETMKKLAVLLGEVFRSGVPVASVYLLSRKNCERSSSDLDPVLRAEEQFVERLLPRVVNDLRVRVVHAGANSSRCESLIAAIRLLCGETADYSKRTLNLLVNYDPLVELASAVDPDGFDFTKLDVPDDVDLVIRTGGDARLSDFLPLQCGSAELDFVSTLFNDTDCSEIIASIRSFHQRSRRFGR